MPFLWLVSILCMLVTALPVARAAESDPVTSTRATATLVTDDETYSPGRVLHVGLRLQLAPGWHTYWLNPGDAGDAPTLEVNAQGGATGQASTIEWPTPRVLHDGPLTSYAYTGGVLLPVTLTPVAGEGDGPLTLVLLHGIGHAGGRQVQCGVPVCGLGRLPARSAQKRLQQPRLLGQRGGGGQVQRTALGAQAAVVGGVRRIATHARDARTIAFDEDAAAYAAIGAGGSGFLHGGPGVDEGRAGHGGGRRHGPLAGSAWLAWLA